MEVFELFSTRLTSRGELFSWNIIEIRLRNHKAKIDLLLNRDQNAKAALCYRTKLIIIQDRNQLNFGRPPAAIANFTSIPVILHLATSSASQSPGIDYQTEIFQFLPLETKRMAKSFPPQPAHRVITASLNKVSFSPELSDYRQNPSTQLRELQSTRERVHLHYFHPPQSTAMRIIFNFCDVVSWPSRWSSNSPASP